LAALLAALILLAGLLVALRIRLLRVRLVLVAHESLFSEKDLKTIFQVLIRYGCWRPALPVTHISTVRGHVVKRHACVSSRKSIDLYLAQASAAQRVQVHSDDMDNAVIYGFWAVGSFAILGVALAFMVW
jgi:hypothetical protein